VPAADARSIMLHARAVKLSALGNAQASVIQNKS